MVQKSLGVDYEPVRGLWLPERNLLSQIIEGGTMNPLESSEPLIEANASEDPGFSDPTQVLMLVTIAQGVNI